MGHGEKERERKGVCRHRWEGDVRKIAGMLDPMLCIRISRIGTDRGQHLQSDWQVNGKWELLFFDSTHTYCATQHFINNGKRDPIHSLHQFDPIKDKRKMKGEEPLGHDSEESGRRGALGLCVCFGDSSFPLISQGSAWWERENDRNPAIIPLVGITRNSPPRPSSMILRGRRKEQGQPFFNHISRVKWEHSGPAKRQTDKKEKIPDPHPLLLLLLILRSLCERVSQTLQLSRRVRIPLLFLFFYLSLFIRVHIHISI